ncbi:Crp/Fnr family transcriptional regulator [bacterium]|nr:Crp/Fnr family transcriptional regulator [bacterium]
MQNRNEFREITDLYPSLAALPAGLSERVSTRVRRLTASADQVLFGETNPCEGLVLLTKGTVRAAKQSEDGREVMLYRLHPGEYCALTIGCLLGHAVYPAAGIAETDVVGYLIPQDVFHELIDGDPGFRREVFAVFSQRLAETMALVEAVTFQRLDQRLARALLEHGDVIETTHQRLAEQLGSVREIVSRLLKGFENDGLVGIGRGRLEVRDRAGLERVAGG